jgi:lysophospholipase L1-like esterase
MQHPEISAISSRYRVSLSSSSGILIKLKSEVISLYKVLCYGDSNTWGAIPGKEERHSRDKRWTGVMRRKLGDEFLVIEEGLNGRTTVWDDPIEGIVSGKNYLVPCLETHKPLNLAVVMLGTNDLKARFSVTAYDVAEGAGRLAEIIKKSETGPDNSKPEILLVAPPPVARLSEYEQSFSGAREKSKGFSEQFRRVSEEYDTYYLDAGKYASSSDVDGIHLEREDHAKLGRAVADRVKEIRKGDEET